MQSSTKCLLALSINNRLAIDVPFTQKTKIRTPFHDITLVGRTTFTSPAVRYTSLAVRYTSPAVCVYITRRAFIYLKVLVFPLIGGRSLNG